MKRHSDLARASNGIFLHLNLNHSLRYDQASRAGGGIGRHARLRI